MMMRVISVVLCVLIAGAIVAMVCYRFVQFWIGFAKGINETAEDARGFEVKMTRPAPSDDQQQERSAGNP